MFITFVDNDVTKSKRDISIFVNFIRLV